jgi:hypothetical protein
MSITKQIEKQIQNDPIFAELYEQHESAKFHRFLQKTFSIKEALDNFQKETNLNKNERSSYNKLHKV